MMDFHSLLKRQIKRHFGDLDQVPDDLTAFIQAVNTAYQEFDDDRLMLERAMELSSTELLQANTDVQGVLEGLLDMLFRIDAAGHIIDCRIRDSQILNMTADELAGMPMQEFPIREVADHYHQALEVVKETGKVTSFVYEMPGEKTQFYDARVLPLRSGEYFLLIQDITDSMEAKTRESELQTKLARSERMESLGILAGGVAHDLNNLLGPLVAYPELILSELGPDTPVRKDLEQIRSSSTRAAAMIQDLLTLARRGARKERVLDMSKMVRQSLSAGEMLDLQRQNPQVQIDLDLDEKLPLISASSHHITQCICNLIMNAFEAIERSGRVRITSKKVSLNEPIGHFEEFIPGTFVVLSVEDDGVGISEEDADHIFEPFYTKKKMGRSGSGLGLSVVYGVVQDNSGLIDVDSALGEGCRIDLYLPEADEPEVQEVEKKLDYSGTERLLVIEDEPDQRLLTERILTRLGYKVDVAENGRRGVEFLRNNHVDLILLDMIMEDDFDGLRTYQEIVQFRPAHPCIVVSGFAENEKVKETQNLGAGAFVRKPYSLETIGRAVREELDRVAKAPPERLSNPR